MLKTYEKDIMIDILSEQTSVPNLLLDYYSYFELTEMELVFIINLMRIKGKIAVLNIATILSNSHYDSGIVNSMLGNLISKGIVSYNSKDKSFKLDGLYDKLNEAWAINMQNSVKNDHTSSENLAKQEFKKIYNVFEQEFGRPLSPKEGEMIKDWISELKMPISFIDEALKRSVMMDKRSFAYINQILLDWKSKRYTKIDQVHNEISNSNNKKQDGRNKSKSGYVQKKSQVKVNAEDIYEV